MVQRVLEQAIPRDLPAPTERRLVAVGRAVWAAEASGTGRETWPRYFGDAPASAAYSQVRIQAAIARRDPARRESAVVHLVWAGADRSGTYRDGHRATVRLIKKEGSWTPTR